MRWLCFLFTLLAACATVTSAPELSTGIPKETTPTPPTEDRPDVESHPTLSSSVQTTRPAGSTGIEWQALDASASIPEWGLGRNPELARDNDSQTAWTCQRGVASGRCALTLTFSRMSKVQLLRVDPSLGETERERQALGRIESLKIHTGQGSIAVTLGGQRSSTHVLLDEAVALKSLTIEVDSITRGRKTGKIAISEVEVFGPGEPAPE